MFTIITFQTNLTRVEAMLVKNHFFHQLAAIQVHIIIYYDKYCNHWHSYNELTNTKYFITVCNMQILPKGDFPTVQSHHTANHNTNKEV